MTSAPGPRFPRTEGTGGTVGPWPGRSRHRRAPPALVAGPWQVTGPGIRLAITAADRRSRRFSHPGVGHPVAPNGGIEPSTDARTRDAEKPIAAAPSLPLMLSGAPRRRQTWLQHRLAKSTSAPYRPQRRERFGLLSRDRAATTRRGHRRQSERAWRSDHGRTSACPHEGGGTAGNYPNHQASRLYGVAARADACRP